MTSSNSVYEDKLTSKATRFVAVCYGSKVEEDMTSYRYHMRKSKIVDHIQYGWHAGDDVTTLQGSTLTFKSTCPIGQQA